MLTPNCFVLEQACFYVVNMFARLPISVRSHCYKSFVRPILEYASPIWAPHLQSDICAIEKIQRSAARYTMNNYSWRSSVTNMLTSLNWPSLESQRTFCKLVMFYKIINCQMEVPSISLTSMSSVIRGHSQRFRIPQARINSYLFSFYHPLLNYGTLCQKMWSISHL